MELLELSFAYLIMLGFVTALNIVTMASQSILDGDLSFAQVRNILEKINPNSHELILLVSLSDYKTLENISKDKVAFYFFVLYLFKFGMAIVLLIHVGSVFLLMEGEPAHVQFLTGLTTVILIILTLLGQRFSSKTISHLKKHIARNQHYQ